MRWRRAKTVIAATILTTTTSLSAIQANVIHLNQTTFLHVGKSGGGAVDRAIE